MVSKQPPCADLPPASGQIMRLSQWAFNATGTPKHKLHHVERAGARVELRPVGTFHFWPSGKFTNWTGSWGRVELYREHGLPVLLAA